MVYLSKEKKDILNGNEKVFQMQKGKRIRG